MLAKNAAFPESFCGCIKFTGASFIRRLPPLEER